MKNIILTVSLLTMLTSTKIYGQTPEHTFGKANIPFAFQVGTASMPAGAYTLSGSGNLLFVRANRGRHSVIVLSNPSLPADGAVKKSSLEFNHYGDRYFLSRVWCIDMQYGRSLTKTKQEQIIARSAAPPRRDEIAFEKTHLSASAK